MPPEIGPIRDGVSPMGDLPNHRAQTPGGRSLGGGAEVSTPGIAGRAQEGKYGFGSAGDIVDAKPIMQASDRSGDPPQTPEQSITPQKKARGSEGFAQPLEDRRPEAATGGGGGEPPIESPTSGSNAESPDERPGKDLERLIEYVSQTEPGAFGSLFVAITKNEPLTENETPEGTDSLTVFDASSTERSKLQFDQELTAIQYQQILETSGLAFRNDGFSPRLVITDGQRFTDTLATIPEGNDTLKKGVKDVVDRSLATVVMAHVPTLGSEEFDTFHLHPTIQSEYVTDETTSTTTETLLHANDIANQLQRLGISPNAVNGLRNVHKAEIESMLPEWAVAQYWGMYNSSSDPRNSEWRQWVFPEEWQKFHEFFDNAVAKAPKDSKFLNDLVQGMITNIKNVRDELTPSGDFLIRADGTLHEIPDSKAAPETVARMEEYDREYDELLTAAEQKLSMISLHPGGYAFMRPNFGMPSELSEEALDEARSVFTDVITSWHGQYPENVRRVHNRDGDPIDSLYLYDERQSELIEVERITNRESGDVIQEFMILEKLVPDGVSERYVYRRSTEHVDGENKVLRYDNEDVEGDRRAFYEGLKHVIEERHSDSVPDEEFHPEGEVDMSEFGDPRQGPVEAKEVENFHEYLLDKQGRGALTPVTYEQALRLEGEEWVE